MVSTSTATTPSTGTWQIDPSHSSVEFSVKHMVFATAKGRFSGVSGTIVDAADPAQSTVRVEIDPSTIDTRDEKRDAHLKSEDFFHVEQFPTMTFESTTVERTGGNDLKVTGNLMMRGVSHEVVLDGTFNGSGKNPWGQEVAGYSANTEINRHDWDLGFNVALEAGGVLVGEKVRIEIDVEASRAQ